MLLYKIIMYINYPIRYGSIILSDMEKNKGRGGGGNEPEDSDRSYNNECSVGRGGIPGPD